MCGAEPPMSETMSKDMSVARIGLHGLHMP